MGKRGTDQFLAFVTPIQNPDANNTKYCHLCGKVLYDKSMTHSGKRLSIRSRYMFVNKQTNETYFFHKLCKKKWVALPQSAK